MLNLLVDIGQTNLTMCCRYCTHQKKKKKRKSTDLAAGDGVDGAWLDLGRRARADLELCRLGQRRLLCHRIRRL